MKDTELKVTEEKDRTETDARAPHWSQTVEVGPRHLGMTVILLTIYCSGATNCPTILGQPVPIQGPIPSVTQEGQEDPHQKLSFLHLIRALKSLWQTSSLGV